MPRFPEIDPTEAQGPLAVLFDEIKERRGGVPQLYRVLGHSPRVVDAMLSFARNLVWDEDGGVTFPTRTRELVILRIAQLMRVDYEWGRHVRTARSLGITHDELSALADASLPAGAFSAPEHAALLFAEEVVADGRAGAETLAEVRSHFSNQQCIDLLAIVGFYAMVGRIVSTVDLDLEPGDERLSGP